MKCTKLQSVRAGWSFFENSELVFLSKFLEYFSFKSDAQKLGKNPQPLEALIVE